MTNSPVFLFVSIYVLVVVVFFAVGIFRQRSKLIAVVNAVLAALSALTALYVLIAGRDFGRGLSAQAANEANVEIGAFVVGFVALALLSGVAVWRGRR